jgi:hypothetical protein
MEEKAYEFLKSEWNKQLSLFSKRNVKTYANSHDSKHLLFWHYTYEQGI